MLPSWWTRRGTKSRPTIRAEVRTPPMQGGANMTMASLIDLDVQVAMGDEVIEVEELLEMADLKVPLVRFRGQWVEIDAEEIWAAATTLAAHVLQKRHPITQRTAAWHDKPSPTLVDTIALVRRHLRMASQGFSLATMDPDVRELPATLYHQMVDSVAYEA